MSMNIASDTGYVLDRTTQERDALAAEVQRLRSVLRLACPTPDKRGVMAFQSWDHERVRSAAWPDEVNEANEDKT